MLPNIGGERRSGRWLTLVVFAMSFCAPSLAGAQTLGTLQGRVLDASEAVVSSAVVRVQDPSTGFDVSVRANAEGR